MFVHLTCSASRGGFLESRKSRGTVQGAVPGVPSMTSGGGPAGQG